MRRSTFRTGWAVCLGLVASLAGAALSAIAAAEAAPLKVATERETSLGRVCGAAWSALGYRDGRAGLEPRQHPFGDAARAAEACREAGRQPPDFTAYRAQYGAARYLSTPRAPFGRRDAPSSPGATAPSALLNASSRPSQSLAPRPLASETLGLTRQRQALDREAGFLRRRLDRPGAARADRLPRSGAEPDRITGPRGIRLRPAERRAAQRRLRDVERRLRRLEIGRASRPQR